MGAGYFRWWNGGWGRDWGRDKLLTGPKVELNSLSDPRIANHHAFDLLAPFRGALLRLSGLHLAVRRRKGLGREPIGRSAAVVVSGRAGGKREAGWRHADSAPMLTMDRAAKGRVGRTVKSERGAGFKGVCACVGGCVCVGGGGGLHAQLIRSKRCWTMDRLKITGPDQEWLFPTRLPPR